MVGVCHLCSQEKELTFKHASIILKSLPFCLDGDFKSLSTFSSRRKAGFLSFKILSISHQRTPFFPWIPLAPVLATE